jgi:hypothetical protein
MRFIICTNQDLAVFHSSMAGQVHMKIEFLFPIGHLRVNTQRAYEIYRTLLPICTVAMVVKTLLIQVLFLL